MITPQSDIILIKAPLELSDDNQITFANKEAQYNYFYNLPKLEVDGATYQRKDNIIRFPAEFDEIIQYNYVMYRNEAYSNKWFYAYITDAQYINDKMTAVTIKTDVFQTWQFDFRYKPCFVEREHVNDDTIGLHTYPEGLETGPFIHNGNSSHMQIGGFTNTITIIGVSTELISTDFPAGISVVKNIYNGVSSGLTYYAIKHNSLYNSKITDFAKRYDEAGKGDAIYTVFECPLTSELNNNLIETSMTGVFYVIGNGLPYEFSDISLSRPSNLAGYIPKNAKLLTAPYNYFYITNNAGADIDYRYEDFSNPSSIAFAVKYAISTGCSIKAYPKNYLNNSDAKGNYNAGVVCSKMPTCAWNSDAYTNWLTQNALNLSNAELHGFGSFTLGISSAVMGAGLLAAGGPAGMIAGGMAGAGVAGTLGGMNEVAGVAAQKYQHSLIPPQTRGDISTADVTYADGMSGFTIHRMCIKPEYARIIDDFMNMYGYKVNIVKLPNITGRRNWNYVKTINSYVEADIPQTDLNEYKQLLDRGITFWHNPSTFLNYSANNAII